MTATGTNFVSTSQIKWNGTALTTTYVSATQLTATVPASDLATAGTASVTVFNPTPGGGTSNALTFTIGASRFAIAVASQNPNSGVPVTANLADVNGNQGGNTSFSLTYNSGASVTLTAPATASGNAFAYWILDGAQQPAGQTTLPLSMTAAHTATAVYVKYATGIRGWGLNDGGQIGAGETDQSPHAMPIRVKNSPAGDALTNAVQVACGAHHTVVLKNDGTVWAFGTNSSGQLGNNSTTQSSVPVQVLTSTGAALTNVAQVAAGAAFSMARTTGNQVYVWGDNTYSECGAASTTTKYPTAQLLSGIPGTATVLQISCGASTAYALTSSGVYSWGYNANGNCGNGTSGANVTAPTAITFTASPTIAAIAAGANHCLAADTAGNVWAWGYNVHGEVGNGSEGTVVTSPVKVLPAKGMGALIAAGNAFSLAMQQSASGGVVTNTVYSWGSDQYGQLGQGSAGKDVLTPTVMLDSAGTAPCTGIVAIAAGTSHSLMLDGEGNVWSCGENGAGELGTGEFGTPASASLELPIQVQNLSGVSAIAASNAGAAGADGFSMALTNEFKVVWEDSANGALPLWEFANADDNLLNTAQGPLTTTNPYASYNLVAAVDLFGDGNRDLLLQNATTGALAYIRLNGTNVVGSGLIPPSPTYSPNELIVGTMNINNSRALVWQNTSTGEVDYWTMGLQTVNGVLTPVSTGGGKIVAPGNYNWQVAAAYPAGGSNWIIWHNITTGAGAGDLEYQQVGTNGSYISNSGSVYAYSVPIGWTLHVEDLNGDGNPDFIWHDTNASPDAQSGETYIWLMNGLSPTYYSGVQMSGMGSNQVSIPIAYYIGGIL